jgi:hypothetical protein
MNNLYWIKDEDGNKVKFKFNSRQEILWQEMWYRDLVLKSRQHGITTFFCVLFLDACLFHPDTNAAVIAHLKNETTKIFEEKVRYPYDNLPDEIKNLIPADTQTKNELRFVNGSVFYIALSARSGTLQYLLISEFGKICATRPDRAKEIVTGSLPTVHQNGVAVIESTAEGREGYFYDYSMGGLGKQRAEATLSRLDYKFFFFGWHSDPKNRLNPDGVLIPERLQRYFQQLAREHGIHLDEGQKAWYAKTEEMLQENMQREHPSYPEEAFQAALQGTFYGRQMHKARSEKRITKVPHDPAALVDTWFDIGYDDDMAIWFVQFVGREIHVIEYYAMSGEGLDHYVQFLRQRKDEGGYLYNNHWAPHDVEKHELGAHEGPKTIRQNAAELGLKFKVVPRSGVQDGIENVRLILPLCWFDAQKCEEGIKALENYKREWNDRHGCFTSLPVHNWASHGADSFRTGANAVRMGAQRMTGRHRMTQQDVRELHDRNLPPMR